MKSPLISIIIPAYNRAHLIRETLDSIRAQTYANWECIVVDDGSTDGTETLINNYVNRDLRFHFYKRPENRPKGPSACRNYGFEMSKGEYINWFDSDDVMVPHKLETDLKNINFGDYDFTISQSKFFGEGDVNNKKYWNTNLWSNNPINDFITLKVGWSVNAPLWRKSSLINNHLLFDEELITADDYFFHIEAIEYKLQPILIKGVSNLIRIHPDRLNEFKVKSQFKLKVNYYIMNNKEKLQLTLNTVVYLRKEFYFQFINLLKNKKTILSFYYLKKSNIYGYDLKMRIKFYYKFLFGLFFKIFGLGYRFL